jgi:hypothetical protein
MIEHFIRDSQISILPPCYDPPPIGGCGEGDPTPAANPPLQRPSTAQAPILCDLGGVCTRSFS